MLPGLTYYQDYFIWDSGDEYIVLEEKYSHFEILLERWSRDKERAFLVVWPMFPIREIQQ